MPQKKDYQCLMLTTPDNRKFFTQEKNYDQLVEFSNTFGADISVVRVKEAQVLDLSLLAPAICNPVYKESPQFEVLEVRVSSQLRNRTRKKLIKNAEKIRNYIRNRFLAGNCVELKKIAKHFNKQNLTLACICNHISTVRTKLEEEGYEVARLSSGKYQLI